MTTTRPTRSADVATVDETALRDRLAKLSVEQKVRLLTKPRNARTGEYGKIRVGFNAGFATDHLVTLVQVLRREHPTWTWRSTTPGGPRTS